MPKTISAFCRSSVLGMFQIKNMDTPISKYKVVQTGPNKYPGGLNDGLFKVANHSGIAFAVSRPAVKPRLKGSISETKSLKSLALSIISIFIPTRFLLVFKCVSYSKRSIMNQRKIIYFIVTCASFKNPIA